MVHFITSASLENPKYLFLSISEKRCSRQKQYLTLFNLKIEDEEEEVLHWLQPIVIFSIVSFYSRYLSIFFLNKQVECLHCLILNLKNKY